MPRSKRTEMESAVYRLFMEGPYRAFGCCRNPTCEDPFAVVLTAGTNPAARICLLCFEFVFDCKFPSPRRLRA